MPFLSEAIKVLSDSTPLVILSLPVILILQYAISVKLVKRLSTQVQSNNQQITLSLHPLKGVTVTISESQQKDTLTEQKLRATGEDN